jgi:hypothetical protein
VWSLTVPRPSSLLSPHETLDGASPTQPTLPAPSWRDSHSIFSLALRMGSRPAQ